MADIRYVLDASAVLAAFFDEPGAGVIAELMDGALLSAVNYHEVVAKLVDRGSPPDQILDIMSHLNVELVPVDQEQAAMAGLMRADTRAIGLSLGDRTCLALAKSRNAVAVTADGAWRDVAAATAIEILVIR